MHFLLCERQGSDSYSLFSSPHELWTLACIRRSPDDVIRDVFFVTPHNQVFQLPSTPTELLSISGDLPMNPHIALLGYPVIHVMSFSDMTSQTQMESSGDLPMFKWDWFYLTIGKSPDGLNHHLHSYYECDLSITSHPEISRWMLLSNALVLIFRS